MISGPRAPKAADTKQLRHILEPELIKLALPWVANDDQAQVVLDLFTRYSFSYVRCTIYSDLQCSNGHTLPLIRDSQLPICELMPVFEFLRNIGREKKGIVVSSKHSSFKAHVVSFKGFEKDQKCSFCLKHFDTFLLRLLSRVRHGHHTNNNRIDHFQFPRGSF